VKRVKMVGELRHAVTSETAFLAYMTAETKQADARVAAVVAVMRGKQSAPVEQGLLFDDHAPAAIEMKREPFKTKLPAAPVNVIDGHNNRMKLRAAFAEFLAEWLVILPEEQNGELFKPDLCAAFEKWCSEHGLVGRLDGNVCGIALRSFLAERLLLPPPMGRGLDAEKARQFLVPKNFVRRYSKRSKVRNIYYRGIALK